MSDDIRALLRSWVAQAGMEDLAWLMMEIAKRCGPGWAQFLENWKAGKSNISLTVSPPDGGGSKRKSPEEIMAEIERLLRERGDNRESKPAASSISNSSPNNKGEPSPHIRVAPY